MLKSQKILSWIRDFHPSSGRSIKFKGNGDSHAAYLSSVDIPRCLPFDVFKGTVFFINLPSPSAGWMTNPES
jgi:hypothetical protein